MTHQAGFTHYPEPEERPTAGDVNDSQHALLCRLYQCQMDMYRAMLNRLEDAGLTKEYLEAKFSQRQAEEFEKSIRSLGDSLSDMFFDLILPTTEAIMADAGDAEVSVRNELDHMDDECLKEMQSIYDVRRGV